MTSIVALHDISSPSDLDTWRTEFDAEHILLDDDDRVVFDQYRDGFGQPWYVVFDRDMSIVYKGLGRTGAADAETAVLDLLGSR